MHECELGSLGRCGITRRQFIKSGVCLAGSGFLLQGCGTPVGMVSLASEDLLPDDLAEIPPDGVVLGLSSSNVDPVNAVRTVCRHLDWSWLSQGDSVLVKIACNSSFRHPAVTSPNAVRAILAELFDRGAARVLVGDQGGVEQVRLASKEQRFGSTRELMNANGLLDATLEAGGDPYFFDEHGFDEGYYEAETGEHARHWTEPLYLADIIQAVDHIIYVARLSSHSATGYTAGQKAAVGWLRDDSRYDLHIDAATLHERYVEINYVPDIRDRLRLTITLAEDVLLDAGPNVGTLANLDGSLVIASSNLANHDAVGVAVLSYMDRRMPEAPPTISVPTSTFVLPFTAPYRPLLADLQHRIFVAEFVDSVTGIRWGDGDMDRYTTLRMHDFQRGIDHDIALSRAYAIESRVPNKIPVKMAGNQPREGFLSALQAHDNARLDVNI